MQFQDWKTFVFTKYKVGGTDGRSVRENSPTRKLQNETDVPVLNYIDSETKNKIISMRNAKGYTQAQLAQKLNVDKSVIASYESGKVIPNKNFIQRIYKVLA